MPNKKIKRIKVSGETYDLTDTNAVQKTGDTMTGDLYVQGSPSTLVDGQTYHIHIPAGTNMQTVAAGQCIVASSISNIVTTIPTTTRMAGFSKRIGQVDGSTVIYGVVGDSSSNSCYSMIPASADFDCDFVFSQSGQSTAGDYTNLLQFIKDVDKVATVGAINNAVAACVKKTGDTMTGDLTMNGNITLSRNRDINLDDGNKIIYGAGDYVGTTFEIKTVHGPTGSEHIILLSKVDTNSGIKFIQKANMSGYGVGYHQLPVNDGSSANNYYTLATQEYVDSHSGGISYEEI